MKNLFGETKGLAFLNGTIFGGCLVFLVGTAIALKNQLDKNKEIQNKQKDIEET